MEYVPESVRGYTADGTVFYWNKASEQIYGYTAEEAIGKNLGELIVPPDLKQHFQARLEIGKKITKSGEFFPAGELFLLHKEGYLVPVYSTHTAVYRQSNEPLLFCIDVDLSAIKKAGEALLKSEEKYRSLVETTSDWIWEVDQRGVYTFSSPKVEEILGYEIEEVLGKTPFDFMPDCEVKRVSQTFKDIIESKKPFAGLTNINIHKTGREIILETSGVPVLDANGTLLGLRGIDRDITARKKVEEALLVSEEKYRSLVESSEDSIYLVDRMYNYLYMNKKHIARLGLSDYQYLGRSFGDFHSPDETKWFIEKAKIVLDTGNSVSHEHKSLRDGRYFLLTLSPVKKEEKVLAVTVVSKDITEYKEMEEALRALSITDELTGLYNRRGFFTLTEQFLKLARRQKKGIFILYADVDNLKEINDSFGHKEGDMALIETADILKKNYRESDIIARIGGDEFVVVPIGTAGDDIDIITSRFEKSLEICNSKRNREYTLSLSYGLASYDPGNPCSIDELLTQADKTMYEHKKQKKN
jgi:diguanylate cyclase (GGDEF)-like protein/PAS domain S-box-containing protein